MSIPEEKKEVQSPDEQSSTPPYELVNTAEEPLTPRLSSDIEVSGTLALASMSDDEFEKRLELLKKATDRTKRIKLTIMQDGVHYGTIPGTQKPTLLKPGAEILCRTFGLHSQFKTTTELGDGITKPQIRIRSVCLLHYQSSEGPLVDVGEGAANSWETKYRYRNLLRKCPNCGMESIIAGKEEFGGGWLCWKKKGGCGAKFTFNDERITGQEAGKQENPDPYELENTLLKMAIKRSYVDATLRATNSSDLFTQDMEEEASGSNQETQAPAQPGNGAAKWIANHMQAHALLKKDFLAVFNNNLRKVELSPDEARAMVAEQLKMKLEEVTFAGSSYQTLNRYNAVIAYKLVIRKQEAQASEQPEESKVEPPLEPVLDLETFKKLAEELVATSLKFTIEKRLASVLVDDTIKAAHKETRDFVKALQAGLDFCAKINGWVLPVKLEEELIKWGVR